MYAYGKRYRVVISTYLDCCLFGDLGIFNFMSPSMHGCFLPLDCIGIENSSSWGGA